MVNTATKIDGQTIAIEGQETQEADEPPIGGLKRPNLEDRDINHQKQHSPFFDSRKDGLASELPTAGSSILDTKSSDGGTLNNTLGSWDGDPGAAHLIDAADVAAQLAVDPKYITLNKNKKPLCSNLLIMAGLVFQPSKLQTVSKRMVPTKSMEQVPSRWPRFCLDRSPIV